MRYAKGDDITLLVPAFRERVQAVLDQLTARGFTPVLRDGMRTRAEAAANARRGVGIADSMHCYGVAADVICAELGWQHPEFFAALGEVAEDAGLVWGGRWKRRDLPHLQGVPVAWQDRVRRAGSPEVIDGLVRRFLRHGRP